MVGKIFSRVQKKWDYLIYLRKIKDEKRFYRSRFYRFYHVLFLLAISKRKPLNTLHLIPYKEETALGPVQRDEAILLFGLIRSLRPKTVLEIGYDKGLSAFNFLAAMDSNSKLYSLDRSESSYRMATYMEKCDHRFRFIYKSQTEISPDDFDNRRIDFLFIDASHDYELNKITFKKIDSYLTPTAILVIHDTGLWQKGKMSTFHLKFASTKDENSWINEQQFAHQPGERKFANWIVKEYPSFSSIHLHTERTLRHGMTILQKSYDLETPTE